MPGNDNYDRQLRMLDNLNSQLDALHQYVDRTRESYRNQIRASANQGFMDDYADKLDEKFRVFSTFIDDLFDSIASSKQEISWQEERVRALQADANREP